MSIITTLLNNPFVQGVLVGGVGWLANKVMGKRANTKAGKVTAALATSAAIMTQFALTEAGKTPKEMLVAFHGVVAIQFAKVGIYEKDLAPYQPLIDMAIAKAITEWVKHHPAPLALTMPITETLAA